MLYLQFWAIFTPMSIVGKKYLAISLLWNSAHWALSCQFGMLSPISSLPGQRSSPIHME
jgi:hypothetical protein